MDRKRMFELIAQLAQSILENCKTDEEIKALMDGITKYIAFSQSIFQR